MNFKTTTISFLISIVVWFLFCYYSHISYWWLLVPIIIYKGFIIYGSAKIQANFYTTALCKANTNEKKIAITFDDGPNKEFTPQILSTLKDYNAKATFFVIGKNIPENEQLLKQINEEGHIIGNHSFSHGFFIDFKSTKGFKEELKATSETIYKVIKKRPKLFRPPYGVTTPNLAKASKALNYHIIGWNIRSLDTTNDSEEKITKRVLQQLKPGAIILFHDTSVKTNAVLKQTLIFAKENGFKIAGIEELLNIKAYQ